MMRQRIILCMVLLWMGHALWAQTFSRGEYFIDTDPGVGLATAFNMPGSGDAVDANLNIPVGALSPGFHLLGIRLLEPNGHWGTYELRSFIVSTTQPDAPNITGAEYFIDTDPGVGKGSPLNVGSAGAEVNFQANIPSAGLSLGFHLLGIRLKGADGRWGPYELRTFLVDVAQADAGNITAAEYFIDVDPGQGKGTSIPVGPPGSQVSFVANIPVQGLSEGMHLLGTRTRDANNKWGPYETRLFYIEPAVPVNTPITRVEYFVDTDPGTTKGFTTVYPPAADNAATTVALRIPRCITQGAHKMGVRLIDQAGRVSHYEVADINVSGTANATNNFTLKDGNWNSAAIWSTCEVPTSTVNATVRHTVNVDVDANCRTLRVERPARLEVEPGKKVTVAQ
jgi:hypothetical protein